MITDSLKNGKQYNCLNENFKKAFDYLAKTDLTSLPVGKFEIDGKNVHAMVLDYETKLINTAKWEAHEVYADIQIMISGIENMGYCALDKTTITEAYNAEKDILFLSAQGEYLQANPGYFFIFLPQDAHQPSISINEKPCNVKKLVIKVKMK